MSSFEANSKWHNANGVGLPFRPPLVDEALPYSPFTSIVPFSPDIIPFPSTEPPTPPTTLSAEQQSAAQKAISILNGEIKGPPSEAQHLHHTLRELQNLLEPDNLTEFQFKQVSQLATTPPDSTRTQQVNTPSPATAPSLSPFASMLLKQTGVPYTPFGGQTPQSRKIEHKATVSGGSQAQTPNHNHAAHSQNAKNVYPQVPLASAGVATPARPSVMVKPKPLPSTVSREVYQRYDNIPVGDSLSQKKRDEQQAASTLRPHERELSDQTIDELRKHVNELLADKEDIDDCENFVEVRTSESEFKVLGAKAITDLSGKMAKVINWGRFSELPVEAVLQIQSLLEPTVTATHQMSLFSRGDEETSWSEDFPKAELGLRAARLILDTMVEGRDDRKICPEDLVVTIIHTIRMILHSCIIPVVGARRTGSTSEAFGAMSARKTELLTILRLCGNVLTRIANLIGKVKLSDSALTPIAYLALGILMEQNSETEKDSVFGIQKFEQFRQKSMEVLAQIFACHDDQRTFIIVEILSNLEKLPDKRASARQFKSAKEVPIMSVSALFMRFVQVAATNRETEKKTVMDSQDENSDEEGSDYEGDKKSHKHKTKKTHSTGTAKSIASRLVKDSTAIASHIATSLVERALNVSKTADKPFRNLLDLFIEDFCNVLGSPEWPAAIMLLYHLLVKLNMVLNTDNAKQANVNKDMALATMARMGCGIIDFKLRIKQLKRGQDISQSDLSAKLDKLAEDALNNSINDKDLLAFDGPYRMVIESLRDYLNSSKDDDPHLLSVNGCRVTFWLHHCTQAFQPVDGDETRSSSIIRLQERLESMLMDPKWLRREYKFQSVAENQSRLAAGIITLQDNFCKQLPGLMSVMFRYTKDRSPKLRSRGMSGIEQLLDRDPQIIDEKTMVGMAHMFRDNSPSVREHTLSLVSKCLENDSTLERHFLPYILNLSTDVAIGPKKKAIKLLKDIFLGPTSKDNKLQIAKALLLPSQDDEKTIAELACQALEDIWLRQRSPSIRADDVQFKLARSETASMLIELIQSIKDLPTHLENFEKFLASALSNTKTSEQHFRTCKEMVADLMESVITPDSSRRDAQSAALQAVSIFAKVNPTLFSMDQVELLKMYTENIKSSEDVLSLRPTVTIFRYVFPYLPKLQESFAEAVRASLSAVVSKIAGWATQNLSNARETLVDLTHCLWIVSPLVKSGMDRLCTIVISVLSHLHPLSAHTKEPDAKETRQILSLLFILGTFGKICNFDEYKATFQKRASNINTINGEQKNRLTQWDKSLSSLFLETVRPFTKQVWDMKIREQALSSVCDLCQQSQDLFTRDDVGKLFQLVFINKDNLQLKRVLLAQFSDFFASAERRSDSGAQIAVGEGAVNGAARLGVSFSANDSDSATMSIANMFLPKIVDIALKNKGELALLATKIITSISRQGLVHPKVCGPSLVALGTSPEPIISQLAFVEHQKIHSAHESMFEKEYMAAVRMAFEYQQQVFGDPHGMLETTHKPKMLRIFEILKGGTRKTLKKFIENLCKRIDFELPKLSTQENEATDTLFFARFCLENLALFDYPRLEDVAVLLNTLENTVLKNTGPAVALTIETEMPKPTIPAPVPEQPLISQPENHGGEEIALPETQNLEPSIDDTRLRQITIACMLLQMMWETRSFVRKCYNLHNMTSRIPQKDYQKPTQRSNFVSGKELWERLIPILKALDSRESMLKQCYDFAELLEVDKDAKIGDEEEELANVIGYETPNEEGEELEGPDVPTSGRGRKRKHSASMGNTPKKAKSRPSGGKKKRTSKTPEGDDEWD